jgi:hypothetical protein
MTGISGIEPMLIDDNRILWAGSSLIAVERGGFLYVHNDVSSAVDICMPDVLECGFNKFFILL